MQKNNIIATPPEVFSESDKFLDFTAQLTHDTQKTLQLIESIPIYANNPRPAAIVGNGMLDYASYITKKVTRFKEDHLKSLLTYFKKNNIDAKYTLGYEDAEVIRENKFDDKSCLLWLIEVTSASNIWNDLWGTEETDLAKRIQLPCLCVPTDYEYKKPETLMVISNGGKHIESMIPFDIVKNLGMKVILLVDENELQIKKFWDDINRLGYGSQVGISQARFIEGKQSLDKYIHSAQPDWLACHNFDKSFVERVFEMNTNNFILSSDRPMLIL